MSKYFWKISILFLLSKMWKVRWNQKFSDKPRNLILQSISLWIEFLGYAGPCGMPNGEQVRILLLWKKFCEKIHILSDFWLILICWHVDVELKLWQFHFIPRIGNIVIIFYVGRHSVLMSKCFWKISILFFLSKMWKVRWNQKFSDKPRNLILQSIQLWIKLLGYAGPCGMSNG